MVDKVNNILQVFRQNGFLTYKQIIEKELSYKTILKMAREGIIEIEEKGMYRLPDFYLDEFFILQYRFPKGVFSLETALFCMVYL